MRRVFPAHFLIPIAMSVFAVSVRSADAMSSLTSDEIAAIKARMSLLVSQTSGAQGVFEIRGNGGIEHLQSGGSCPGYVYGYTIRSIEVTTPSPGRDVEASCIYDGGASGSELTLTYSKVEPGATLDSIFERVKGEELSAHTDAEITDSQMKLLVNNNHKPDWADMRSALVAFPSGKATAHVELIVGVTAGWIVKLRAATNPFAQAQESGFVGRLLFQNAPESLFLLEMGAVHSHAAGPERPSELSSGGSPSQ